MPHEIRKENEGTLQDADNGRLAAAEVAADFGPERPHARRQNIGIVEHVYMLTPQSRLSHIRSNRLRCSSVKQIIPRRPRRTPVERGFLRPSGVRVTSEHEWGGWERAEGTGSQKWRCVLGAGMPVQKGQR